MKQTRSGLTLGLLTLLLAALLVSPLLAETLNVPFTGGGAAATTLNSYSGPVWITVSGTGTIAATPPTNDAFYVFSDASGVDITPFYPDPTVTPDSGILWINGAAAQNSIVDWVAPPSYDVAHTYSFLANVPAGTITFGVGDSAPTDDTGAFTVLIEVPAQVDIAPKTLNLRSKGKWVTVHIQLPEGLNPADIDRSTLLLNGVVGAAPKPWAISDSDRDGIKDLMVKFPRAAVQATLSAGNNAPIIITGELTNGTAFVGSTEVRAINPGKGKGKGKNK
jgi:hypothetical protein